MFSGGWGMLVGYSSQGGVGGGPGWGVGKGMVVGVWLVVVHGDV